MKVYEILNGHGTRVAKLTTEDVCFGAHIERGIDFQPNIFNGYYAVEVGADNPPAVLNLPQGWTIQEVA